MASTTLNQSYSQYVADTVSGLFNRPIPIPDWTKKLKRTDTPLLKAIGRATAPSTAQIALKREWGWGSPDPITDTLGAAITDTTGTTFTVSNPTFFAVGYGIVIDTEYCIVTTVGSTTIGVQARGGSGTTAATHSNGATVQILGPAIRENQATPQLPTTQGELDYNYAQIFDGYVQYSHRAAVTPTVESLGNNDKNRAMAEIRKKMETTAPLWLEQTLHYGSRGLGSTTVASTMGGVFQSSYITTQDDASSAPLTEYLLMTQLQTVYNLVGQDMMGKTLFAKPFLLRAIASWYNGARRLSATDDGVRLAITKVDTGWFGELALIDDYLMPDGKLLVCNPSDYQLQPYASDTGWEIVNLPVDGWYERPALRGDWTLLAPNPDSRLLISSLSTTASDYPGLA